MGVMASTPDTLMQAVQAVADAWSGDGRLEGMPGPQLAALGDALGVLLRLTGAAVSQVASEVDRQSRPELGADSFAKQQGHPNARSFLATTLGTSNGEAAKFVQVGVATAPRLMITGEELPALHPHVGEALSNGTIGKDAAGAIIHMLDDVAPRVHPDELDKAEQILADEAARLSLDQLRGLLTRAEAHLDPDGVEPKEEELRAQTSVSVRQDRTGMIVITAKVDPERGAPIVSVLEAMVAQELSAQRDDKGRSGLPPRPIQQMQADALVAVFEHYIGCDHKDMPLPGATVVIRVEAKDLQNGTGFGLIDGIDQPVCIQTVRRMAGGGSLVGWIMSEGREVLDWGRQKRLFTPPQKMLLAERDGGCAGCGAPPGRCKAHHIRWWSRGGRTDIDNGVLLCSSCHHRIHDNGWDIRVEGTGIGARVWLIPPAAVDPSRTPRPAIRRRFDVVA